MGIHQLASYTAKCLYAYRRMAMQIVNVHHIVKSTADDQGYQWCNAGAM